MNVRTGYWDMYLDMDDVHAFRSGKMPPQGAPVTVVRFQPHQIAPLIDGNLPFHMAVRLRRDAIIHWAAAGLAEDEYYCLGILFEVAADGEVLNGEVAFRRRGYRGRTRTTWRRFWGGALPDARRDSER